MAKHPHHDLIVEWAADTSRVVQVYIKPIQKWCNIERPDWHPFLKYRFRPDPKPDVVIKSRVIVEDGATWVVTDSLMPNVRFTFDGETGKLIKAEVIE